MLEILGEVALNGVRHFLFTFDGTSMVLISAFDSELNEIVFPGTPMSKGKTNLILILAVNLIVYI